MFRNKRCYKVLERKGFAMYGRSRLCKVTRVVLCVLAVSLPLSGRSFAEEKLSRGQTLYVPSYSHVYIGDRATPFNLATTLSIRNTDPTKPITLISADYYNSDGNLVRKMMQKPVTLKPLASVSFFVAERDTSGGFGSSFIVRWKAGGEVNVPVVESVMIGSYAGQGISFIGSGREIR